MDIKTHILLGSGRLTPFSQQIQKVIDDAIPVITKKIPAKNVDVIMYHNPEGAVPEQGIGGYCPNGNITYISLDPAFSNLKDSIKKELKRILAHELHHTLRWQNPGYGETLLDAMITEGLADHFDIEVYNEQPQPWSITLSEHELQRMMKKAKTEFDNKEYDHFAWFFGNEELGIPRWTGYAIGFHLVKQYLQKYPDKKPSQLYAEKTEIFV
ncbi:DUF2268 domain-containing protein [soil metagenome]